MTLMIWTTWGIASALAVRLHLPSGVDAAPWRADLAAVEALAGGGEGVEVWVEEGPDAWTVSAARAGETRRTRPVPPPESAEDRAEVLLLALSLVTDSPPALAWPDEPPPRREPVPASALAPAPPPPPLTARALPERPQVPALTAADVAPTEALPAVAPAHAVLSGRRLSLGVQAGGLPLARQPWGGVALDAGVWVRPRLDLGLGLDLTRTWYGVTAEAGGQVLEGLTGWIATAAARLRTPLRPWLDATLLAGAALRHHDLSGAWTDTDWSPCLGAGLAAVVVEPGAVTVSAGFQLVRDLWVSELALAGGVLRTSPWRPRASLELRW